MTVAESSPFEEWYTAPIESLRKRAYNDKDPDLATILWQREEISKEHKSGKAKHKAEIAILSAAETILIPVSLGTGYQAVVNFQERKPADGAVLLFMTTLTLGLSAAIHTGKDILKRDPIIQGVRREPSPSKREVRQAKKELRNSINGSKHHYQFRRRGR